MLCPTARDLRRRALTTAATFAALLTAPLTGQSESAAIDFNRDVRPILSDRCFKCHGFDAQARKADLRLDTFTGLTGVREEGRVPVVPFEPERSELLRRIESDDPKVVMPPPDSGLALNDAERALLRRWIAEGAEFDQHWAFTPPRDVEPPAVQAVDRVRNPVDAFVLRELEEQGLGLSPDADRETLIRRLSLGLTGLPPTPEEIDAFLADGAPDAFEKLVDRLLASEHFGERMAIVWLDAARYADTNGFHHDNVRTGWPYRDWVIRAFNDNLPYDRFVTEQLAGDLLPDATEQQRIATGFCRMHNINDEGGAIDAEYRVEAVCDRIETIATTFMGLTFTCARCHDHKYDPFTQDDYYSLYAIFGSVDERGVYPNDFEQARAYPARLAYRPPELAERIAAAERELRAAEAELAAATPVIAAEREAYEAAFVAERGVEWCATELVEARTAEGTAVERLDDGSVRLSGRPKVETIELVLRTEATDLRLVRLEALADASFPQGRVGLAPNGNAVVSAVRVEAVSERDPEERAVVPFTWAWADHEQPNGDFDVHNLLTGDGDGWALEGHNRTGSRTALLLAERPFGYTGGTLVRVTIECRSRYGEHVVGRPRVTLARAAPELLADFPTVASDWWLAGPFGAQDFATAWATAFGPESVGRLDRNAKFGSVGWRHRPDLGDGKVHALSGERSAFYLARTLRTPVERRVTLSLGSDDALRVFLDGREVLSRDVRRGAAADQERLEITLAPGEHVLALKVVNDGGPAGFYHESEAQGDVPGALDPVAWLPRATRDPDLQERFAREFGRARSPLFARLDRRVQELEGRLRTLEDEAVPVLVMKELPEPRPTYVLARGHYEGADPERPVERRPPLVLGGEFPAGAPHDRLGFAQWLVQPDHPLTARVHVNRIWQMLFGTGLCATPENFGQQADWPSHPELLDWLARWFVRSGWDQKALIRLIVSSSTWRQASAVREAAHAVDPRNRLLASFPRHRLPGELIRDLALFASGLLVERVGGPSVKPYQPDGLWREVSIGASSNTQIFRRDSGEALWRRSLYTFWKRTSPNPQMATFDAPTREFCTVRRSRTNTPLQALVLWNDEQFVEAARVLARRTLEECPDDAARLVRMFRRCTGRHPEPRELAVLQDTLLGFAERYRGAPRDARALLEVGEVEVSDAADPIELAAYTMVASTLFGLAETIIQH